MIICGYAGIGKSYLGHNFPNVIDLESTPFEKDWDRYVKCAIHYHKQGYLVLVSCHKELRKRLCEHNSGVGYGERMTVVPNIKDKETYRQRYANRGNTEEFIKTQMDNWEKWLTEKDADLLTEFKVEMECGETLYDCLKRLATKSPSFFCNYDGCPAGLHCEKMPKCKNPLTDIVKNW
jgi:hypothetical protein